MNKAELVAEMAKKLGGSRAEQSKGVECALDIIKAALKKGDNVVIVGFGTFAVKQRAARMGVNPQTKEKIKIKAKKVPVFRAGKELKEAVA